MSPGAPPTHHSFLVTGDGGDRPFPNFLCSGVLKRVLLKFVCHLCHRVTRPSAGFNREITDPATVVVHLDISASCGLIAGQRVRSSSALSAKESGTHKVAGHWLSGEPHDLHKAAELELSAIGFD
jgi:hypothetical protein